MKRLFFLLAGFAAASFAAQGQNPEPDYRAPENTRFRIIGYAPGYRNLSLIPDHTLRRLDVACYAFATIDSTGIPRVNNEKQLRRFARRARRAGTEVMLSFNGRHAYYARMVASPESRKRFIDALWRVVRKYRLAGVDNDWEYPLGRDGSGEGNLLLMKELAQKCREGRRQYYLTAAITPGKYVGGATAGIPDALFDYVDWFNVMVYDDYSEVRPGMHHSTYDLMLVSVDYWVGVRGLPMSKFVVGLPAYGVPSGIARSGNTRDYNGIIREGGSCMADTAMITSTRHPQPYPVYYNGIRTIRAKTRYALGNGLGGVMFWEAGGDRHDDLSLIGAAYRETYGDIPAGSHKKAPRTDKKRK